MISMRTSFPMRHRRLLALTGILALFSLPVAAQEAAPLNAPAAPKGANTPLQAAQQPPPPPPPLTTPPISTPPAATPSTPAIPKTQTLKPGEVLLNFQAAEIQGVVKAVGQMTGRNFLLDPRVKGQITIISARPVTTTAAYQIFLSALKAQGFTAVPGIGVTKIVPTTEAKANADVTVEGEPRGGEQIVTHVLIVQHTSATQMIPLLRPLMSPTSQLSSYEQANALIITDYADNIRRMMRIVEKIDQPVSSDVTVIGLKHASALDISDLVTRLSLPGASQPGQPGPIPGSPGGAGDRFNIVPDLRTNSLLVRADNPGRVNQVRSLIEKLDVPALTGGQTRVIYLRNADAVKLAEVLRGLLAGESRSQGTAAAAPPVAGVAPRPAGGGSKTAEASLIQADEATNALIINAADATYNNLRGVIEKLDVRRTQVYVEALIVEMSTDAAQELGVQWAAGGKGVAGVQNFPGAKPGLLSAAASISADPLSLTGTGGLLLGFFSGEKIRLPDGTVIRGLGALARFLEQNSMANILSTPNLMTLDNAEAKIVVGQNVPFLTGSFAQAGGGTSTNAAVNPFQTIERKDVGLTLKIKPQVSEGGTIKLDIYQEVSNVVPTSGSGASDLITNKRSIDTKVLVDDGHTIILGGLIEDNRTSTEQSIPGLGKLPLIGWLFRYKENTGRRTNLMVFLRPLIIHGPQESFSATADRYDYLRARTQEVGRQDVLDRFKPTPPTPEELKRYKKRSNDPEKPAEPENPENKPAAEAPVANDVPPTPTD